jgi:hypothetical protein
MERDLRKVNIQDWRVETEDQQDLRRIVWEAKVYAGL